MASREIAGPSDDLFFDAQRGRIYVLTSQGFMAEWSVEAGALTIAEHNCAVHAVAQQFPEICRAEEDFLRDVLGADIVRRAHIPAGCNSCEYAVPVSLAPRAQEPA